MAAADIGAGLEVEVRTLRVFARVKRKPLSSSS
jgi:hypothetical protein